jgi:hypothetical protein
MQFLPCHNITSARDEHYQDLQRLFLELNLLVFGPQFSRASIELVVCETDRAWQIGSGHHVRKGCLSEF